MTIGGIAYYSGFLVDTPLSVHSPRGQPPPELGFVVQVHECTHADLEKQPETRWGLPEQSNRGLTPYFYYLIASGFCFYSNCPLDGKGGVPFILLSLPGPPPSQVLIIT